MKRDVPTKTYTQTYRGLARDRLRAHPREKGRGRLLAYRRTSRRRHGWTSEAEADEKEYTPYDPGAEAQGCGSGVPRRPGPATRR